MYAKKIKLKQAAKIIIVNIQFTKYRHTTGLKSIPNISYVYAIVNGILTSTYDDVII